MFLEVFFSIGVTDVQVSGPRRAAINPGGLAEAGGSGRRPDLWEAQTKSLPLSSLRKAPLGESGILPHRLLGLGKSLSVLRVCSLKRQYLHRDEARETKGD